MNNSIGKVLELFVSQKEKTKHTFQAKIEVDKEGIVGDKFYAKDISRSILLTSVDSYDLALQNSIHMSHGALGENILIDYNPYNLAVGTHIKIGKVVLEITQNCTICNHLSHIDKALPVLLKDDRGVFVKVIEAGIIEKGDKLYLL
ncbi:MAG: Unknown protein [uncultured Sulfurovum sp.]|uniref:MOSC domain-containing protein n=1 Tax=uncultured Sulfurovum sp. TaxID=269237 RepID=A0A6S6TV94_9BACT|nr:MAG: Unknown protein [uncultured Sulfurovum sp.]